MKVSDKLRQDVETFTSSERKISSVLLADYPFSGLLTVAALAKRANVSTQTVLRLTTKLGFDGFGSFQKELVGELKEGYQYPVTLREKQAVKSKGKAYLNSLAEQTMPAMKETATLISDQQFDEVCSMLSDPRRSIFFLGGRITHLLAGYLFRHIRQIRKKAYLVPEMHEEWPEYLLRMSRNDIVVMFDFRRYQPDLELFAQQAATKRKSRIILITDPWLSPVAKYSTHVLPNVIDVGTPWDTACSAILLIEGMINNISESDWPKTKTRIEEWEALRLEHKIHNINEKS